jgi:di/tricarboxylate transporter
MDIASGLGISPQACAMVLAVACSSAFISPFGSTIPMLVREPGGYGPADYAKTGLPMLLLCMLATVLLARLLFS